MLIALWREAGTALFDMFSGPASIAIVDSEKSEALIAIDRIGIHQMSFALSPDGVLVFASDARAVCRHPAIDARISRQALFNYLYFYVSPGPPTIFEGVEKLQPGQFCHFRNGTLTRSFYWQPAYAEPNDGRAEDYAE